MFGDTKRKGDSIDPKALTPWVEEIKIPTISSLPQRTRPKPGRIQCMDKSGQCP